MAGAQPAQLPSNPLGSAERLPLRRPHRTGRELRYLAEAIDHGDLSANGPFTQRCAAWFEQQLGASRVLLTPSCTAALDLAAGLVGLGHGDEVVMPSFTSVSTAIAVTRSGATAVFADIDPSTLNLDPAAATAAVTKRTRAVLPVHYAGVACDMEAFGNLARDQGLALIEDAAHAAGATWRGTQLGAVGDLGCLSFHETKNLSCGEGGALIIRDTDLVERAEILQNKGTNRTQFLSGQADHYTWVDQGASYLMSELNAAFLWGQIEGLADLTARRLAVWHAYHERLAKLEQAGALRRPVVPVDCRHNAHIYHVLLSDRGQRDRVIATLAGAGIETAFHYVPLHSSPAGPRFGRVAGDMTVTDRVADRLLRLPLWPGMTGAEVERVVDGLSAALRPK